MTLYYTHVDYSASKTKTEIKLWPILYIVLFKKCVFQNKLIQKNVWIYFKLALP